MKPEDVPAIYDRDYAQSYDRRFLTADYTSPNTNREIEILRSLLGPESTWLDVGCGTGFYLSKFPEVRRAGLDISPAMIALAEARNPNALFRLGDFRDPVNEWKEQWSIVSCMWSAYSYVETIADVEAALSNIIDWTAVGGTVFLPILDLLTLREVDASFRQVTGFFSGETQLNGCIWSWTDVQGEKVHGQMIAPQTDQFVEWLSPHFDEIGFILYPPVGGMANREALLARGKRSQPDHGNPARVSPSATRSAAAILQKRAVLNSMSVEALIGEVLTRTNPSKVAQGMLHRLRRMLAGRSE